MTYFPDLSTFMYWPQTKKISVVQVGWLERGHDFPVDTPSDEFLTALLWCCNHARAKQTRGIHSCDFCDVGDIWYPTHRNKVGKSVLGSAEIWIPFQGKIFAAPDLVYHYVSAHHYLPPSEFIDAVINLKISGNILPEEITS